jgi:chromosome segregation ATPase
MSAPVLEQNSVDEQLRLLTTLVEQLQREVRELRRENAELRCELGYWKSMHARAVDRNTKLQAELDQAKAEIRQLKAERFGKQSEKQSATDRSNQLDDPRNPATPKKKRGQQPGRPAPKRRDYSHLSAREELIDLAEGPAQEHLRHEHVDAPATGKVSLAAANAPRHRAASAVGTEPRAGNDR